MQNLTTAVLICIASTK